MIYAALLRGINVGGKASVNMATLKDCFEQLGFQSVRTYINSGNVVFQTVKKSQRSLEKTIEAGIEKAFGFPVTTIVLNLPEYRRLTKLIPDCWKNNAKLKCNVLFLRHEINNPDILISLKVKEGIEQVIYYPGVLFWAAKTSDLTKSSLVKLSSRSIYKNLTVRNLNTTLKIYECMLKTQLN
jgi:uncharacterized protein (DUF1697 family)